MITTYGGKNGFNQSQLGKVFISVAVHSSVADSIQAVRAHSSPLARTHVKIAIRSYHQTIMSWSLTTIIFKPTLHTTQCRDSMSLTLSLVPLIVSAWPFNSSWRLIKNFCSMSLRMFDPFWRIERFESCLVYIHYAKFQATGLWCAIYLTWT